jgi:hypothetical protein
MDRGRVPRCRHGARIDRFHPASKLASLEHHEFPLLGSKPESFPLASRSAPYVTNTLNPSGNSRAS